MGRLATVLRSGYQMCRMNMEHLTRRTNIDSTETATLKSVSLVWVLALVSVFSLLLRLMGRDLRTYVRDHTNGIFGRGA